MYASMSVLMVCAFVMQLTCFNAFGLHSKVQIPKIRLNQDVKQHQDSAPEKGPIQNLVEVLLAAMMEVLAPMRSDIDIQNLVDSPKFVKSGDVNKFRRAHKGESAWDTKDVIDSFASKYIMDPKDHESREPKVHEMRESEDREIRELSTKKLNSMHEELEDKELLDSFSKFHQTHKRESAWDTKDVIDSFASKYIMDSKDHENREPKVHEMTESSTKKLNSMLEELEEMELLDSLDEYLERTRKSDENVVASAQKFIAEGAATAFSKLDKTSKLDASKFAKTSNRFVKPLKLSELRKALAEDPEYYRH